MKRIMLIVSMFGALLMFGAAEVMAQSPVSGIMWWTIDSGGAEVSSGSYTLRNTLGQPDAARVSAGWYELQGGYWSGAVVRHPRNYLPLLMGYLKIEHQVTYGQITIVALTLCLIFFWRQGQRVSA